MEKYINKYKNEMGATIFFIAKASCCGNRVEWSRGDGPTVCPYCGNKYYKKPNLENKLFCLQDAFLEDFNKTGSTKILGEKMFPLIQEYAENLIKALVKGKKSLSADDLKMRAYDASTLLVEVIMKDPDHRMRYSFGKYLGDLCKSVCYSAKKHEQTYSLNAILRDGETELGDMIIAKGNDVTGNKECGSITINNVIEMKEFREDVVEKIIGLIVKSAEVLYATTKSYEDKILYLQGLFLKFNSSGDTVLAGFFEKAGRSIKNYVEKGELLVFNEIHALLD